MKKEPVMLRPILFNTEMVRAIQEGRKDTTRRLVKRNDRGGLIKPYAVGDVLWVRETWDFLPCITCMERDCTRKPAVYEDTEAITEGCWIYRADSSNTLIMKCHNWRPSIHMPKAAARIFLRVTEVRREKLQDITDEEARDEGCGTRYTYYKPGVLREAFAELWDSTAPKGRLDREGWAANPDVWEIRFEVCEKPEGWPG